MIHIFKQYPALQSSVDVMPSQDLRPLAEITTTTTCKWTMGMQHVQLCTILAMWVHNHITVSTITTTIYIQQKPAGLWQNKPCRLSVTLQYVHLPFKLHDFTTAMSTVTISMHKQKLFDLQQVKTLQDAHTTAACLTTCMLFPINTTTSKRMC